MWILKSFEIFVTLRDYIYEEYQGIKQGCREFFEEREQQVEEQGYQIIKPERFYIS